MTLLASDGFEPGIVYGVMHVGRARVLVRQDGAVQDIVLDGVDDI